MESVALSEPHMFCVWDGIYVYISVLKGYRKGQLGHKGKHLGDSFLHNRFVNLSGFGFLTLLLCLDNPGIPGCMDIQCFSAGLIPGSINMCVLKSSA